MTDSPSTPTPPPTPPRTRVDRLQVGDHLSRVQYYKVVEIDEAEGFVTVENTAGFRFKVLRDIVEAEMFAASQFEREEQRSRTELAELLTHAGDTVFTVRFRKQLHERGIADKLADLPPEILGDAKARRAFARELLEGEERTLVGYLVHGEPKLGRSMVIDLELSDEEHNVRMVDHRTIFEMIYKNVRYYCE